MAHRIRLLCYVCEEPFHPRQMAKISGDMNKEKRAIAISRRDEAGREPLKVNERCRVCINCNISIRNEIEALQANPACLRLNVLSQTRNASCIFCDAVGNIRRLSVECRVNAFVKRNIYIPEQGRSCDGHLDEKGCILEPLLPTLQYVNRPYVIKGQQLQAFLEALRQTSTAFKNKRYEDENDFNDDEFHVLTSLTKDQFRSLFEYCDPVPRNVGVRSITKRALLTFLCKLRQGLSDNLLQIMFGYSTRQAVSLDISTVRQSLMARFVPENIGFQAITRQNYITNHVTEFANGLYNPHPNIPCAIAYIDGTYSYINKSNNFRALRQSYSRHKGRHLVKPALIVAPDGYILAVQGPYFSDTVNNDAAMLRNEFDRDIDDMRAWFREGDLLIVDLGYRDAAPVLEGMGILYKMPAHLQRGQRQLSTEGANMSRLITKTRWIVEARNGHYKSMFKFFQNTIGMPHISHLGELYQICGGIINKYHPPVLMHGVNAELAGLLLQRATEVNIIQATIEAENLLLRRGNWVRLDQHHLPNFPRLTLEFLRDLTVGVYQIGLAPSYLQDKWQREGQEHFEIDLLFDEYGFVRFRLFSRFRRSTKYQLWIAHNAQNEENEDLNIKYYCTCRSGARTLGACAHVTCILWYLGYARHEENVKYPSVSLLFTVLDAANRPPPDNVERMNG